MVSPTILKLLLVPETRAVVMLRNEKCKEEREFDGKAVPCNNQRLFNIHHHDAIRNLDAWTKEN